MIVRMMVGISGSRNDSAWPQPGGTLEVSEAEGRDLISIGLAVEAEAEPEPEPEPEPVPEVKVEVKAEVKAEVKTDDATGPDDTQPAAGGPPKPAASKQEWIDWAVSQGADWITATNATKQQLMEQYGQRP